MVDIDARSDGALVAKLQSYCTAKLHCHGEIYWPLSSVPMPEVTAAALTESYLKLR
jgi:hypothetical protein